MGTSFLVRSAFLRAERVLMDVCRGWSDRCVVDVLYRPETNRRRETREADAGLHPRDVSPFIPLPRDKTDAAT